MLNNIQKTIYNLSAIVPICVIFSIVWYVQMKTLTISIISIAVGLVLFILFECSFYYGIYKLETVYIRATNIAPYNGWIVPYLVSYVFPLTSIFIKDLGLIACFVIGLLMVFITLRVNTISPSPILFLFQGYKYFKVTTENGISDYILISKSNIRDVKKLKTVKRIFEYMLINIEETP